MGRQPGRGEIYGVWIGKDGHGERETASRDLAFGILHNLDGIGPVLYILPPMLSKFPMLMESLLATLEPGGGNTVLSSSFCFLQDLPDLVVEDSDAHESSDSLE